MAVDGDSSVAISAVGFVALGISVLLCFTVRIPLFTFFGCVLLVLAPFGFYEYLKIAQNASYQFVVHRAGQMVERTNKSQGQLRRKTGAFKDVQMLHTVIPGKYSVKMHYVQMTCEQGIVWIDAHLSAESARQIAESLAQWLGVELKPPMEVPYFSAVSIELLLPRVNPWKNLLSGAGPVKRAR